MSPSGSVSSWQVMRTIVSLEARRHRARHLMADGRSRAVLAGILILLVLVVWRAVAQSGPALLFSLAKAAAFFGTAAIALQQALLPHRRGYWEWWLMLPWPRWILVLGRWLSLLRLSAVVSAVVLILTLVVYDLAWSSDPAVWLPTRLVLRQTLDLFVALACLLPALCAMAQLLLLLETGWPQLLQTVFYVVVYSVGVVTVWGNGLADGTYVWNWTPLLREWLLQAVCAAAVLLVSLLLAVWGMRSMPALGRLNWMVQVGRGRAACETPASASGHRPDAPMQSGFAPSDRDDERGPAHAESPRFTSVVPVARDVLLAPAVRPDPLFALWSLFFSRWRTFSGGIDVCQTLMIGIGGVALFVIGLTQPVRALMTVPVGLLLWGVWFSMWRGLGQAVSPLKDWFPWLLTVPVRRRWLVILPTLAWWTRTVIWMLAGEALLYVGMLCHARWLYPGSWPAAVPVIHISLELLAWLGAPAVLYGALMQLALVAAEFGLRGHAQLWLLPLWAMAFFLGPWLYVRLLPSVVDALAGGRPVSIYWLWLAICAALAAIALMLLQKADEHMGESLRDPRFPPRAPRR